jgi:hypothetical protein
MSVGIVMLVHTALGRATQVARFWAAAGCPVAIHVDKSVPRHTHDAFVASLSDQPQVRFSARFRCEWGTWGLVKATRAAAAMILDNHPEVGHVYLTSGSCLPLRPAQELQDHLTAHPQTDFIESVAVSDVPWTVGGLEKERFTLWFPVSWKRNRWLFDRMVDWQRRAGFARKIPGALVPHVGSQWWCLSRQTLSAILSDPELPRYDRYFKNVWIPDESYFQTLVRLHSDTIQSRSLTLSKFDFQGKPHVLYDDHIQLLRHSDAFVARKIWPYADRLYDAFLNNAAGVMQRAEPDPAKVDRVFSDAFRQRTRGRPGLYMQSRFPRNNWENGVTAGPYGVFHGFSDVFEDFPAWLAAAMPGTRVHGHLFHKKGIQYAEGQAGITGALTGDVPLRNYNAKAFLTNLILNTKGERQCFQFSPADHQRIRSIIAKDANARVSMITGAWAVSLFHAPDDLAAKRTRASDLQRIESAHIKLLKSSQTRARVRIWTLADFIVNPAAALADVLKVHGADAKHMPPLPTMVDLQGFDRFLRELSNEGLQPYLVGEFKAEDIAKDTQKPLHRPYIVR